MDPLTLDGPNVIRPNPFDMYQGPLPGTVGIVLHPGQWEILIFFVHGCQLCRGSNPIELSQIYALWNGTAIDFKIVIIKTASRPIAVLLCRNRIKQLVRGRIAKPAFMLKDIQFPRGHEATCSTSIVFKHVHERLKEQFEVSLRESRLLGKRCRDKAIDTIQAVWNILLASHRPLFVNILLVGNRHASDAHFLRDNRINRLSEAHLNGPSHLSTVNLGCHNSTKGTNVVKVVAHKRRDSLLIFKLLGQLLLLGL